MIRQAKPKDKKGIIDVATSTKIFTKEEIECLRQDVEEFFETENQDSFFIYEEDKKILGFVMIGPLPITNKSWCLYWIAVDKSTQGKGVGKKLVERIEKETKKEHTRLLFIETSSREEYEDTRAFYMRCGYLPVCTIPDYYNYLDGKVIFSKRMM